MWLKVKSKTFTLKSIQSVITSSYDKREQFQTHTKDDKFAGIPCGYS